MKSKFIFHITGILLAALLLWGVIPVNAKATCDPWYVTKIGNTITIIPTGVDDTTNLQCAFNWAVDSGPGVDVHLAAGDFLIGQVVINDFQGKFFGEGMYESMLYNLPALYVTPVDMYFAAPSAENPWPSLISFINGDFEISDLGLHIVGDNGTTGWSIFGIDPPITELALGIVILGESADVLVERISIEGEVMENSLTGFNLINGVYFEGFLGEDTPPLAGSFRVTDSVFKKIGSASPVTNVTGAAIVVNKNEYDGVRAAFEITDFLNSTVEFQQNKVNGDYGVWAYNIFMAEDVGNSFLIKYNQFSGENGIVFEQTFGENNTCYLQGNDVQQTSGVYLGPNIHGCVVIAKNAHEDVVNEGKNNTISEPKSSGYSKGITMLEKVLWLQ